MHAQILGQQSGDDENQQLVDEHHKHDGSNTSTEYLNTDGNAGENYLHTELEQKQQSEQTQTQQSSGRHAEPTPSDTEAANILTTIKSGDLLRTNDNKDISVANTIAMTTLSSAISTSSQNIDDNVKILFNSEPQNKTGGQITNIAIKTVQKTAGAVTSYSTTANTGDLDALASAALQASSGKFFHSMKTNQSIIQKFINICFRTTHNFRSFSLENHCTIVPNS